MNVSLQTSLYIFWVCQYKNKEYAQTLIDISNDIVVYDYIENNESEKVSLLGKWLWSENATKKETKELAKILINSKLFGSAKQYR